MGLAGLWSATWSGKLILAALSDYQTYQATPTGKLLALEAMCAVGVTLWLVGAEWLINPQDR